MRLFFILIIAVVVAIIIKPTISQCDTPLTYTIGTIDPSFKLSPSQATTDIQQAAQIWNQSTKNPLLVGDSQATITINFVYDNRSALNQKLTQEKPKLEQKATQLDQEGAKYQADVNKFKTKLSNFNHQVEIINQNGGASPDQYQQLTDIQNSLKDEGQALNARGKQYNQIAQKYDFQVQTYNKNVSQFNQAIAQKPEEGLYNYQEKSIAIYFATNETELIHTLSHEFGHALGMDHTSDPHSIMYPYVNNDTLLSPEDQQQLEHLCRQQFAPLYFTNKLPQKISEFTRPIYLWLYSQKSD